MSRQNAERSNDSEENVTRGDRSLSSNFTAGSIVPVGKAEAAVIDLSDAPNAPMPRLIKPMLATLLEEPFDDPGWIFEIKWDGYRAVARVSDDHVILQSRSQQPLNLLFPRMVDEVRKLGQNLILDGEIVVLDEDGKANFQSLQNYHRTRRGSLVYYVFDILYLNGHDLRRLPLTRRKKILRLVCGNPSVVRYNDHIDGRGIALFKAVTARGIEGIVGKRKSSFYVEGTRSKDWVKIKGRLSQQCVVAGFTLPRGSRKEIGALILGVYDRGQLVYVGHVGGGFDEVSLSEVRSKLETMIQPESAFRRRPRTNAPVTWVKPDLVCEVAFAGWTDDGLMRQPVFLGLRHDAPARSVTREYPVPNETMLRPTVKLDSSTILVDGHPLQLTNQSKLFWPDEGYTKWDLIEYYRRMAPIILPYLQGRPESLHRHPDGIAGPSFFQKDVDENLADWIATTTLQMKGEEREITYLLCQNEATLVYLANLGCVEINPWGSRVERLQYPDYLVVDLDPVEIPFAAVIDAAQVIHDILDRLRAPSFCKTSGATGLHVYVPLGARYTWKQARMFADIIARSAFAKLPKTTSLERNPATRRGRVYLDCLQNRLGATIVAPYSLRPMGGAPVSTPLLWQEVNHTLDPRAFNIRTVFNRLDLLGDIFKPILGRGIDMESCLAKLSA